MKFTDFPAVKELQHPEKAKLLKYIGLMYGRDSQISKLSIEERHKEACKRAGLTDVADLFPPKKDTIYATLVFQYLALFLNSNKYHSLMANQHLFWRLQRIIMDPESNVGEAMKASSESEALDARIEQQWNDIFGSKEVVEMAQQEARKIVIMTPESRIPRKVGGQDV